MPFLILNKEDESLYTTIIFEDSDNAEGYISRNHLQNVKAINVAYADADYRLNKKANPIKEKTFTEAQILAAKKEVYTQTEMDFAVEYAFNSSSILLTRLELQKRGIIVNSL